MITIKVTFYVEAKNKSTEDNVEETFIRKFKYSCNEKNLLEVNESIRNLRDKFINDYNEFNKDDNGVKLITPLYTKVTIWRNDGIKLIRKYYRFDNILTIGNRLHNFIMTPLLSNIL